MSIISMEPRPIPIEELKPGEFYDIQSSDQSEEILGALLLEQLPNNRVKLMLTSSSVLDHDFTTPDTQLVLSWRVLRIETVHPSTVYPYQTFTHQPSEILHWPNSYENEELICQIKEEMHRTLSEACWTFNLPYFCEGYLQVYLSYLRWRVDCPNREELVDLWLEFMSSFFSVLRDHILRVKVLSAVMVSGLLKIAMAMNQLSEMTLSARRAIEILCCSDKLLKLAKMKKSFVDSYRPIELSSGNFDELWKVIEQKYHKDLITWQLQEPLSLRSFFVNPDELIEIISQHRNLARDLMDVDVSGLDLEEILRVKFRIAVAAQSLQLADKLIERSGICTEESSRIMFEEESILTSCSEKLEDLVLSRADMVPSVMAYLKSILQGTIRLGSLLRCVTARIAVEDWQFITFLINHNSFGGVTIRERISTEKPIDEIKKLIEVSLTHNMRANLLRDLLPYADYGPLVFPTLFEKFWLRNGREMMFTYFTFDKFPYKIDSFQTNKEILLDFLRYLISRIVLEDWQFITFALTDTDFLYKSFYYSKKELCEYVKSFVAVALEHGMSPELFADLFECGIDVQVIFSALIENISLPNCKDVACTFCIYRDFSGIEFCKYLTTRIAVEDWEYVNFVIRNRFLTSSKYRMLRDMPGKEVERLIHVALEHKMSESMFSDLFPREHYGHTVFPALAERFSLQNYRQLMINYLTPEFWKYCRFLKTPQFLKCLTARIAVEDWEFVTFFTLNANRNPMMADLDSYQNVPALVDVALQHNMSGELLGELFPCLDYGDLIFPALAERFHLPSCSEMIMAYCKPGWSYLVNDSKNSEKKLLVLLNCMTTSIALEDWKFVKFIIERKFLISKIPPDCLGCQDIYISVQKLVDVSIEHHMNGELLRNLLPTEIYGFFVFPAFVEGFGYARNKGLMFSYFETKQRCIEYAIDMKGIIFQIGTRSERRKNKKNKISQYLKGKKLNVYYALEGGVQLQFMWIRQYLPGFLKRLSPSLAREVCSFLD